MLSWGLCSHQAPTVCLGPACSLLHPACGHRESASNACVLVALPAHSPSGVCPPPPADKGRVLWFSISRQPPPPRPAPSVSSWPPALSPHSHPTLPPEVPVPTPCPLHSLRLWASTYPLSRIPIRHRAHVTSHEPLPNPDCPAGSPFCAPWSSRGRSSRLTGILGASACGTLSV